MPMKSTKVTIGVLASVCLVTAANAQEAVQDDRFTPRVYGSLAVTPAQISPEAARISGVTTTRNVIVDPVSATGNTRVIPSSSPTGSYTYAAPSAVQAEAQRVIAFQQATQPSISESYTIDSAQYNAVPAENRYQERRYEVELFEPAAPTYASTTTYTSAPTVSSYATHTVTAAQSHYVEEGDNLYRIAKRYNTNVDALKSANNLTNNNISIGQNLTIPSTSRHVIADNPVNNVSYNQTPAASSSLIRTVQPVPRGDIFAVLPNDTLHSIAKRACVTVAGIQANNGLGTSTTIHPGDELTMPAGHCLK